MGTAFIGEFDPLWFANVRMIAISCEPEFHSIFDSGFKLVWTFQIFMSTDLARRILLKEKRAMEKLWAKREKQIQRGLQ